MIGNELHPKSIKFQPGQPQGIAPTIHEAALRAASHEGRRGDIVGAIPCGRPGKCDE
ncbi:MAG: hypothetical protein ABI465_16695 [Ktedonobacteraceae bacterium]